MTRIVERIVFGLIIGIFGGFAMLMFWTAGAHVLHEMKTQIEVK